jgi:hypothetical protein
MGELPSLASSFAYTRPRVASVLAAIPARANPSHAHIVKPRRRNGRDVSTLSGRGAHIRDRAWREPCATQVDPGPIAVLRLIRTPTA